MGSCAADVVTRWRRSRGVMNAPEGTVKSLLSRGRVALRTALTDTESAGTEGVRR